MHRRACTMLLSEISANHPVHLMASNIQSASLLCQDDNMSDTGLGSELVDTGPGPLRRLLADIYEFEVSIKDLQFECHSYPFALKSSFFKNKIESFKNSIESVAGSEHKSFPRQERPILLINLSELPGGSEAFELIRDFCYDSRVPITKENVLGLLSASKFLGFTEDIAPDNLYARCQGFIENHGVQGILSVLAHSTNDYCATDYNILINKLAEHMLEFQKSDYDHEEEIVELLLELTKLKPCFVNATLQEFERLGVNMVDFFWCTETSTNLDSMLSCDEDTRTNVLSIFSYFGEALDKCIAAGEVQIDRVDPKKLVILWTPGVLIRGPMLSEDVIKAYVSSKLYYLEAEDIIYLNPQLVRDLVSTAVSSSRREEVQHLAGLIDQVLVLEAERSPWDGSLDSKENFKEIAECVPLNERESHDLLYDAVASFSKSFSQAEATEIWNMIDTDKLSDTKFEAAISFTLSHESNYWVRLLRRRQDNHNSLKRKISVLEDDESKRKTIRISDYCGTLFSVFVRSLDGKTLSLQVQSHTTVNTIKEEIAKRGTMQIERYWWLIYRGKKLLDSLTIASYGIQKDCTLDIKVLHETERERSFRETERESSIRDPQSSRSTSTTRSTREFSTSSECVCGCT